MNSAVQQYHIGGETAKEIAASIEALVREGEIAPGERLPTIRELAVTLDVSPTTVGAAYRRLQQRGVAHTRGRNGTVVAPRPATTRPTTSTAADSDLRDLASGNPDPDLLVPLDVLLGYAGKADPVLYGAPMIIPQLADAIHQTFQLDGFAIPGITVTNGSLDAIERALAVHLRYGDTVGVEDPTYSATLDLLPALGYQMRPIQIDEEGILPSSLEDGLEKGLDAVIITPRAQNPTGAAFTVSRASQLRNILESYPNVLVIEDDHAADIAGTPNTWVSESSEVWLVVRSLSKAFAPDLRIAVCIGDETTTSRISGRFALGPGWVSHHIQSMAAAALSNHSVRDRLITAKNAYSDRRQALLEQLQLNGIQASGSSGFNLWIPVRDEVAVVQGMRSMGYAIAAGSRFRQDSPPGVRVTVSTLSPESSAEIATALIQALPQRIESSSYDTRSA